MQTRNQFEGITASGLFIIAWSGLRGVVSLATSLAVEWAPKVRVLTVSPGLVRTEQSHLHFGDEAGIAAVPVQIRIQCVSSMPAAAPSG